MVTQIDRYFRAVYGDDYAFRAPETFENALERWMLYSTSAGGKELAAAEMRNIEAMAAAAKAARTSPKK
jgi:hypothetical protein